MRSAGFEGFVIEDAEIARITANAELRMPHTGCWRGEFDMDVVTPVMLASGKVPVV